MNKEFISLAVFLLAYILFVILPHRRTKVSILSVIILILVGAVSQKNAFWAINWNVMAIFILVGGLTLNGWILKI
ncbi:MAG: hypothetical protein V1833_02505 [Elusimicrobiota bacterium]